MGECIMRLKSKTLCFSGHRPEKLPANGDVNSPEMRRILSVLFLEIDKSVENGYTSFITGVAKGVDLWAAKYVIQLKEKYPELSLICAVPYKEYGKSWKGLDKWDLEMTFDMSDEIVFVSESYTSFCMRKRNEYMVDNSSKLIAVVSDYRSGTGQTIRYAQRNKLETKIIDADEMSLLSHI